MAEESDQAVSDLFVDGEVERQGAVLNVAAHPDAGDARCNGPSM